MGPNALWIGDTLLDAKEPTRHLFLKLIPAGPHPSVMLLSMEVRAASDDDAEAVAAVHVRS